MLGLRLLLCDTDGRHTTTCPVWNCFQNYVVYAAYNITKKNFKVVVIWY